MMPSPQVPCAGGYACAGGGAVAEEVGIGRVARECRFYKLLVSDTEAAERPTGPDRWLNYIRRTVVAQRTQPSLAACSPLPEFGPWLGGACIALSFAWLTTMSCAGRKPAVARRRPGGAACRRPSEQGHGIPGCPSPRTTLRLVWMATASH